MRNPCLRMAVGLTLTLAAAVAVAVPAPAVVDAVQSPAFLSRGGITQPLYPGMEVRNGDQISTGEGAKAYLKLAEGSTVKLGESAKINFYSSSTRPNAFYRGAVDVLTGAFRFTTGLLAKANKRDVRIRVGTATVGIRGTDVWGKNSAEKDLVCLIEGHVQISHPSLAEPVDMPEAMTFFVANKGSEPDPVVPVDPAQLKQWSAETDIQPGAVAITGKGRSLLKVGEVGSEEAALDLYDRLRMAGYPARIQVKSADEGFGYQVVVGGLVNRSAASRLADSLSQKLGVTAIAVR